MQWTDAEKALPDDDTLVLVAMSDREVWFGYRDGDIWRHGDGMPVVDVSVTHWMPLPPAPGAAA